MRVQGSSSLRLAIAGALLGALLAVVGFVAFPLAAVAGGVVFVVLGAGLAYDLRGLGEHWVAWKRTLGPSLGLSAWLDRTLDGAAVAWLGVALAWAAAGSLF